MSQSGNIIDATDIAAYGYQIDLASNQSLFDKLIPRASRFFENLCGVEPGYFDAATYAVWESLHTYAVGDVITPRTSNAHRYEVTTVGVSGASEPVYPTGSGATVSNGSIVLTERGTDVIAATDKVVYGSGGVFLALPPHVGDVVSVVAPSGFAVAPTFITEAGYLRVTDSLAQAQDVGGLPWERNVPYTVTAVWGFAADDLRLDRAKQATVEMLMCLWRSRDSAWTKAINLDNNQLTFEPAIPKRVKTIAASFRNARPSTSAFV